MANAKYEHNNEGAVVRERLVLPSVIKRVGEDEVNEIEDEDDYEPLHSYKERKSFEEKETRTDIVNVPRRSRTEEARLARMKKPNGARLTKEQREEQREKFREARKLRIELKKLFGPENDWDEIKKKKELKKKENKNRASAKEIV
jgi:hypothetical protein